MMEYQRNSTSNYSQKKRRRCKPRGKYAKMIEKANQYWLAHRKE